LIIFRINQEIKLFILIHHFSKFCHSF